MYAVHFVLFVMTLVLSHIIQSCLKPFLETGEAREPADDPGKQQSTAEGDDNCEFAPWSGWSECTVTCGDGVIVRHRIILIVGNCTGDMVQEKVCSRQHCPHDKEFIFQRKNEENEQSSTAEEDNFQQKAEGERLNDGGQQQREHEDANQETPHSKEKPGHSGRHVSGYSNMPNENVNPDSDVEYGYDGQTQEDDMHGRTRGHSWTSDERNAWGHQSSFESMSGGEGNDNCFSDCSPLEPPADRFGSAETFSKSKENEKAKSAQGEDQESFGNEDKTDEGKEESFREGDKDGFKEKDHSKNKESLKADDQNSNDEDNRFDAETDFEADDDDDFDAGDDDDAYEEDDVDDIDEDGTRKDGSRKQKRENNEEEDIEQDDLEQEQAEGSDKHRRRKRRRRKQKRKKREGEKRAKTETSDHVCDPTEISDTFMNVIENRDSCSELTSVASESENYDVALANKTGDC